MPPTSAARSDTDHPEGSRISVVARFEMIVTALALMLGALAVTHAGPFATSTSTSTSVATSRTTATGAPTATDIRGTWNMLVTFEAIFLPERMVVTSENRSTGVFSGTVQTPVGVGAITGTVSGTTLVFQIILGTGKQTGTASVVTSGGGVQMHGEFSSPTGVTGTITATRSPG